VYISPYCRPVLVPPNFMKFGIRGQLTDVITCVKFLVDRFRGYGVLTPPKLPFPIDLLWSAGSRRQSPWSPPSSIVIILPLHVPTCHLAAVGHRSFPVAVSIIWHSLPPNVESSASLSVFRHRLKTFLFRKSFSDITLIHLFLTTTLTWTLQ